MNETLMRAIMDLAAFFALSSDDEINPDIAVAQLEVLGAALQQLSAGERGEFRRYLNSLADEEEAQGASAERIDFLRNFTANVGLTE